ncbi:hypothetical protein EDL99_03115 [Ornithobacterium rhinotracheale]|uniref:hypothetical protein n=1 Tax=Ornithobacterium rhinotracheale TaxID=28251 RepID=UPI00129CC836|nr:hypothetical protein [Ornithobacterium rhinotracheale]MRJ07878.1 hypothetical protein [Ornithobacterium rhinotracheale]UOH78608.1 hypothetical protein MT996_03850 [Ornithobacterium rhinotracheale]
MKTKKSLLSLLFLILFFASLIAQEKEENIILEKIELPEINLVSKNESEKNFLLFKQSWKNIGTLKGKYKGVFNGIYIKDSETKTLKGSFEINYNKRKIVVKSIDNEDYLEFVKKAILGISRASLFPYEVITKNTEKKSLRCIDKGNNAWGFRITQNLRERYEVEGEDYIFIVKINEKGVLEEIRATFEDSEISNNYNLITHYGMDKKEIVVKNILAELRNPKTNNILKMELYFAEN